MRVSSLYITSESISKRRVYISYPLDIKIQRLYAKFTSLLLTIGLELYSQTKLKTLFKEENIMAILESVKKLAEKLGAETNGRDITDQLNKINKHLDETSLGGRDIAEAVKKLSAAMPEYEVEYDLLTEEPLDWNTNYFNYFYKDDDTYVPVEKVDKYDLTDSEPEDWSTNYSEYFTESSGVYTPVSAVPSANLATFYKSSAAINYNGSESTGVPTYDLYKASVSGEKEYTLDASSVPSGATLKVWDYDSSDGAISELYLSSDVPGSFTTSSNAATIKVQMSKNATDVSVTTLDAPTWTSNTYYSYEGKVVPTFEANTYYKKDNWK